MGNSETTTSQTRTHNIKKEKAEKMIGHYKNSRGKKKEPHWVKYDADVFRNWLADKNVKELKFITASYTEEDGERSDSPTILVQLMYAEDSQAPTFSYADVPKQICPPPDGSCDSSMSLEM